MKKKVKNQKLISKKKIFIFLFSVCGIILLGFLFWKFVYLPRQPVYKIETRVSKVSNMKKEQKEPIVGWIRVQGTNIDYPVIYNSNNVDIEQVQYDFGWVNNGAKTLGNREIIFGHNILNVSTHPIIGSPAHSRFEQLMGFVYYDFAKENQYIQYTFQGKEYLYKIFAVSFTKSNNIDGINKNYTKKELNSYIKEAKQESFYDYSIDVDSNDDILTLITCTRFYGMDANVVFKVDARRVRKKELISQYQVAESTKYDKIKEEMKGETEDEKV